MMRHCCTHLQMYLLTCSFLFEVFALGYIIANIDKNIFFGETFYILNFAFFYVYLHFV